MNPLHLVYTLNHVLDSCLKITCLLTLVFLVGAPFSTRSNFRLKVGRRREDVFQVVGLLLRSFRRRVPLLASGNVFILHDRHNNRTRLLSLWPSLDKIKSYDFSAPAYFYKQVYDTSNIDLSVFCVMGLACELYFLYAGPAAFGDMLCLFKLPPAPVSHTDANCVVDRRSNPVLA